MADSNTVSTDDGTNYNTTINGGLPGTVDTVSNPSVPAPALGLEREILDYGEKLRADLARQPELFERAIAQINRRGGR